MSTRLLSSKPISYIVSAILSDLVFSVITVFLMTYGPNNGDQERGAIGSLMIFLCSCGLLTIVPFAIMELVDTNFHRRLPVKYSLAVFLLTYFPALAIGIFSNELHIQTTGSPAYLIMFLMLILSYVAFFHISAESLLKLDRFTGWSEVFPKIQPRFLHMAAWTLGIVILIILLVVLWLMTLRVGQF